MPTNGFVFGTGKASGRRGARRELCLAILEMGAVTETSKTEIELAAIVALSTKKDFGDFPKFLA